MGKVVKKIKKAVKKSIDPVTRKVLGDDEKPKAQAVEAPVAAPPPAQVVEAPKQEDVQTDDAAQTEAGRKKARAGGKKSLSVARSSGTGINV